MIGPGSDKKMPHFAYFPPPGESDPRVFVENTDGEIRVFSELWPFLISNTLY